MGDQMDTHFVAMEEGGGVCLKVREDCMEAAPVFEDQTARRKIPPQPPTPFPLQPIWDSTLYNITGSLCSSFLNQESPPHRGRAETCSIWLRQHNDQLSVLTVCQDDHRQSDRSAFDKTFFVTSRCRRCYLHAATGPELSHYIIPLCIQQETDPCNPLVLLSQPRPALSRWPLRGSIFYIDVT